MPDQIGWFVIWQDYISFRCMEHETNTNNSPHVAFPVFNTEEFKKISTKCGWCLCKIGEGDPLISSGYSYVYYKNFSSMLPSWVKVIPRLKELFAQRRNK